MLQPRSEDDLLNALKRLEAGPGPKGGRYAMGTVEARMIMEDAITELVALRAANMEWVCRSCKTVHLYAKGLDRLPTCPVCDRTLVAHSIVKEDALRARVYELMERVELLESVVRFTYDEQDSVDLNEQISDQEA